MVERPALWHASTRKEAMDLLEKLWISLDDVGRESLSNALLAGPPVSMMERIAADERETSRDRRVYDRIAVLERLGEPPLSQGLANRMAEIREAYPQWRPMPSERAHFGSWMEMRWGPTSNYSVDDLAGQDDDRLLATLWSDDDEREGLIDAWRQLATSQPKRAFALLERLATMPEIGPADVWEAGLRGLRASENLGETGPALVALLAEVPDGIFADADTVRGAADILETLSRTASLDGGSTAFWKLFDRTAAAAAAEEQMVGAVYGPDSAARIDWVSEAVNRSLGRVTTAFLNMLFTRRLGVGAGIPEDLRVRLDRLMVPGDLRHRVARTLAASRISYLYAIDSGWAEQVLVPCFDWSDEEESIAMWQGYAWQARIDPQLWSAIKPYFLPLFRSDRLARMGAWSRNIAQSLMLVGVAFGIDEFGRDDARAAIAAMPEEMRGNAAAWIAGFMEAEDPEDQVDDEEPISSDVDERWRSRVAPWIKRVWPRSPTFRSDAVSEQFAMAAIATDEAFPEAVETIRPFLLPMASYRALRQLAQSRHPDRHPRESIVLLDGMMTQDQQLMFEDDLRSVIGRIGTADDTMVADNAYRRWVNFVAR